MPGKIGRLLALSDAEFSRRRKQRTKLKAFEARPIDLRTFYRAWERHCYAAVRVMAVVACSRSSSTATAGSSTIASLMPTAEAVTTGTDQMFGAAG